MSTDNCDNKLAFGKCYKALVKHSLDVNFVFDSGNDYVKVPANKVVLAELSPVFNAMFNGELKEKGDVKITDASCAAFQEFLQFFHDFEVQLTMENIAEVLKLIDKYDIPSCFTVCSDFLKKNTKIVDILWLLHLAVKFNLDDLMRFCTNQIQQNYKTVFDMICLDRGQVRITSDLARRMETEELEAIFPYVIALSKNIISNFSEQMEIPLLPVSMATEQMTNDRIEYQETVEFSINNTMLLTHVFLSKITGNTSNVSTYITIFKKPNANLQNTTILSTVSVIFNQIQNIRKELNPPVRVEPNQIYSIVCTQESAISTHINAQQANIPNTAVELAPGVSISFPQSDRQYTHSLISKMYFKIAD